MWGCRATQREYMIYLHLFSWFIYFLYMFWTLKGKDHIGKSPYTRSTVKLWQRKWLIQYWHVEGRFNVFLKPYSWFRDSLFVDHRICNIAFSASPRQIRLPEKVDQYIFTVNIWTDKDWGRGRLHPAITRTNVILFWIEPECRGLVLTTTNSSREVDDLLGGVQLMSNSGQAIACSGFLGGTSGKKVCNRPEYILLYPSHVDLEQSNQAPYSHSLKREATSLWAVCASHLIWLQKQ